MLPYLNHTIIILLLFLLCGCKNPIAVLEIRPRTHQVREIMLSDSYHVSNDSILQYERCYKFESEKKCEVYFLSNSNYEFPNKYNLFPNDSTTITYWDKMSIILKNKNFTVSKYYYDEAKSLDEERLIFYAPEVGILNIKYLHGGTEIQLLNQKSISEKIIYSLGLAIRTDQSFYNKWDYSKQFK